LIKGAKPQAIVLMLKLWLERLPGSIGRSVKNDPSYTIYAIANQIYQQNSPNRSNTNQASQSIRPEYMRSLSDTTEEPEPSKRLINKWLKRGLCMETARIMAKLDNDNGPFKISKSTPVSDANSYRQPLLYEEQITSHPYGN
jgi:hypothetical protein